MCTYQTYPFVGHKSAASNDMTISMTMLSYNCHTRFSVAFIRRFLRLLLLRDLLRDLLDRRVFVLGSDLDGAFRLGPEERISNWTLTVE